RPSVRTDGAAEETMPTASKVPGAKCASMAGLWVPRVRPDVHDEAFSSKLDHAYPRASSAFKTEA
ncbi:MAG: hypothetical protein ABWX83_05405, partial [Luteibacter sp.]